MTPATCNKAWPLTDDPELSCVNKLSSDQTAHSDTEKCSLEPNNSSIAVKISLKSSAMFFLMKAISLSEKQAGSGVFRHTPTVCPSTLQIFSCKLLCLENTFRS